MKLKKTVCTAPVRMQLLSLAACGGSSSSSAAPADNGSAAAATSTAAAEGTGDAATAEGEVSVFYYTYADTYISSVRTALDAQLTAAGVNYQDYDSNGSQTTQTEAIQTAISKGSSLLVVNLVDSGSDDLQRISSSWQRHRASR